MKREYATTYCTKCNCKIYLYPWSIKFADEYKCPICKNRLNKVDDELDNIEFIDTGLISHVLAQPCGSVIEKEGKEHVSYLVNSRNKAIKQTEEILDRCINNYDTEAAHADADEAIENLLERIGGIHGINVTKVIEKYDKVKKYYA